MLPVTPALADLGAIRKAKDSELSVPIRLDLDVLVHDYRLGPVWARPLPVVGDTAEGDRPTAVYGTSLSQNWRLTPPCFHCSRS